MQNLDRFLFTPTIFAFITFKLELMILLRPSSLADVSSILAIIGQAQLYFKQNGIDQWQNGYPNEESIKNDVLQNNSYVLIENQEIVATAMISFKGEPTYHSIDGHWISDLPYSVVHRLAVKNEYKGNNLAVILLKQVEAWCLEKEFASIRIDTHQANLPMQRLIAKCGFEYCGIIQVSDGTPRRAYEKTLL